MPRRRRTATDIEAERRLRTLLEREGDKVRRARRRRRWTQKQLGAKVGLAQPTISQVERGKGGTLSLETWQRIALVLDLPLRLELGRDPLEEPADAGHLDIQELVMRLGRRVGYGRSFELQARPSDPRRWTDVGLRDDARQLLVLVECVNTFGDIGASFRSSDRKRGEAEAYAIAIGHGRPYRVHACLVVRATRRNRQVVGRYPELFAARCPGSSLGWVKALVAGGPPPADTGLVWCDVGATRLWAWRRSA